jgi:hypothetical protein
MVDKERRVIDGVVKEYDIITDSWWTVPVSGDKVVESVVDEIRHRSVVGVKKYGVTLERTDLSLEQWVQHAMEEAMDLTLYLKRIQMELKKG